MPLSEGISFQQTSHTGAEERCGRGEPQRTHEAGSNAEKSASRGLRSTRTTARQRDVPEYGRPNTREPELLLKTHLTAHADKTRCPDLQYISSGTLHNIEGKVRAARSGGLDSRLRPGSLWPTSVASGVRVIGMRRFLGFARAARGIFRLAPRVLDSSLQLLNPAFRLRFGTAGPLAGLTLRPACYFVHLAFHSVSIHSYLRSVAPHRGLLERAEPTPAFTRRSGFSDHASASRE